jgi:hypothetical protein
MTIILSISLIIVSVALFVGTAGVAWHRYCLRWARAALKERDDLLGKQCVTIALQATEIAVLKRLNKVTYHALMSEDDWDAMSKQEFDK